MTNAYPCYRAYSCGHQSHIFGFPQYFASNMYVKRPTATATWGRNPTRRLAGLAQILVSSFAVERLMTIGR
eukprot:6141778-Pyramimonas_sp.AAC.1